MKLSREQTAIARECDQRQATRLVFLAVSEPEEHNQTPRELRLLAAVEALPELERCAIRMWARGYSYSEIADVLGCTREWARRLRKKALNKLREELTKS